MTFTELPFLYFLLIVYGLWLLCRHEYRRTAVLLLVASLVFYGYHRPALLFLLLSYCLVDWAVAWWIPRSRRPAAVLAAGVTFNLLVLAFWKYTPLVLKSIGELAFAINLSFPLQTPGDWMIPFGISFYAFTGIAYLVDVYQRRMAPEPNPARFALYMSFFPHMMAGPILRARNFLKDLQPGTLPRAPGDLLEASGLLARGLFKKMVLADRIALAIDPFFSHIGEPTTAGVWSLPFVYLYAWQIYFDFSGYTDMARGLALLFGFRWPENFNLPYLAGSVQEFWQRWHITLSQFLRDYLYIPLGGNRKGPFRTQINLMLTMLLGGLWHGASWSFLMWGGLHGLFLVGHRLVSGFSSHLAATGLWPWTFLWRLAAVVFTFHCVCLAWCFFRLTVFSQSLTCVRQWFVFDGDKTWVGGAADMSLLVVLACYGAVSGLLAWLQHRGSAWLGHPEPRPFRHGVAWGFAASILVLAVVLSPGGEAPPFIYFQF
jgi:alginate O-acetyltransferase complex protein AlgI